MNTGAKIQVKLYATLRKFLPDDSNEMDIDPGTSVRDLLKRLGIPDTEAKLIFINGRRGSIDTILKGGERLGIFPPVGGG